MKFWTSSTWPWLKKEVLVEGKIAASSRGLGGCFVWVVCRRGEFCLDVTDGYDHIASVPISEDMAVRVMERIEARR